MSETTRLRRVFAAALAVAMTAGCSHNQAASTTPEAVTLTFTAYGGVGQQAMIDAYQKPYTAAHPEVTFINTSPPDISNLKAQVLGKSVKWDVVAVAPGLATLQCDKLFEPVDATGIDTKDLVAGTIGRCYVGNFINADPIAYRTDAFPDPAKAPKTVADFFNVKKFPGQRGMFTSVQNGILEYALLADGVAPKDMYPLDVGRALKKLGTIRKYTTFAPNVGALQQAVEAKQVDLFILPDSRLLPLLNHGDDITIVWNTTVTTMNGFAIPKGSPHKAAAQRFLKTLPSPESVARICAALGAAPVNKAAKPQLSANARKVEVFGPADTGGTLMQDIDWYSKNFDSAATALSDWLAS